MEETKPVVCKPLKTTTRKRNKTLTEKWKETVAIILSCRLLLDMTHAVKKKTIKEAADQSWEFRKNIFHYVHSVNLKTTVSVKTLISAKFLQILLFLLTFMCKNLLDMTLYT